jgi:hypothetical protein
MTKQEIYNAIKNSLTLSVGNGVIIIGYVKQLALGLGEEVDSIANLVDTRHQDNEGRLTK